MAIVPSNAACRTGTPLSALLADTPHPPGTGSIRIRFDHGKFLRDDLRSIVPASPEEQPARAVCRAEHRFVEPPRCDRCDRYGVVARTGPALARCPRALVHHPCDAFDRRNRVTQPQLLARPCGVECS